MKKVFKWLDLYLEEAILCVLLAAMTCVMFMQICLRFLFHNTLIWPEEFSRYCFIYTAFFCIPMCIKLNKMLKVDIVVNFIPEKIRQYVLYLGDLVSFAIWMYLWVYSWDVLRNALETPSYSQTMGFNEVIIYGMPVVALGLATFRGIQRLVREGRKLAVQKKEGGDQA